MVKTTKSPARRKLLLISFDRYRQLMDSQIPCKFFQIKLMKFEHQYIGGKSDLKNTTKTADDKKNNALGNLGKGVPFDQEVPF